MAEARTRQIAPSNVDALRGWDGDEGADWAANADHFDRAIAAYDDRFLAAADVQDADRVLDVVAGPERTQGTQPGQRHRDRPWGPTCRRA